MLALIVICICIKIIATHPKWVERVYSQNIYTHISIFFRNIFGWMPFSIGDVCIAMLILRTVLLLVKGTKALIRHQTVHWQKIIVHNLNILLGTYIIFMLLWGLNYNRLGIAYQLQLSTKEYSTAELDQLTKTLIAQTNNYRKLLDTVKKSNKELFHEAVKAYQEAQKNIAFLQYTAPSVKPSLYSEIGNYMGYAGYYNPFTGEAQVNSTIPYLQRPYVICHEMAHQLGYATEDEANFVGYMAASSSRSTLFRYSVYADLFRYANAELYFRDSLLARNNYQALDTMVKKDFDEMKKFYLHYQSPVENVINAIYTQYLKANNQPQGLKTYNEVISLLMASYRKNGKI